MNDYIKTTLLLGSLTAIVVFLGGMIGGRGGLMYAFMFSILMNIGAYFFSDKLALSASGAQPLDKEKAPQLYTMVEDLAMRMKIPMPALYMIPSPQANAFATGRSPDHASVAVTEGIMRVLEPEELKAVLAHELGHVKNRDILISTVAAMLAGVISMLAQMSFYGGFRSSDDDRGNSGLGLLLGLLAPIGASIIQLAVSREREYEADESGAETLKTGKTLASALMKIQGSVQRAPAAGMNPAYASLYIENPIGHLPGGLMRLFSTHPPTEKRVERLLNMKFH